MLPNVLSSLYVEGADISLPGTSNNSDAGVKSYDDAGSNWHLAEETGR